MQAVQYYRWPNTMDVRKGNVQFDEPNEKAFGYRTFGRLTSNRTFGFRTSTVVESSTDRNYKSKAQPKNISINAKHMAMRW